MDTWIFRYCDGKIWAPAARNMTGRVDFAGIRFNIRIRRIRICSNPKAYAQIWVLLYFDFRGEVSIYFDDEVSVSMLHVGCARYQQHLAIHNLPAVLSAPVH